ncbi:hypothetical protein [Methanococcoides sp. LMO-2]|uniref:DUF456 domain-containing protein n=1 Tax=Methanococcoides cohabitans TaxID=3136559 RepID=A0ABU9KTI2_9EURY
MVLSIILGSLVLLALLIGLLLNIGVKKSDDGQGPVMYPKGYWLGRGIAIGILLGIPLGIVLGISTENIGLGIALGPAMGLALGSAIGSVLEKKHKENLRPLTEEERRVQRMLLVFTISFLILGVTVLFIIFYLLGRM